MGWFREFLDDGKNIGRYAQVPAYFNFIGLGNEHDKEAGNFDVWRKNIKRNLKWIDKHPDKVIGSVDALPSYEDHAIVFVGMSPSIKNSWKYLKNLDERFVIVATNSSAQYLMDRGVRPHYVIAIDGRPGAWTLDLGNRVNGTIGLFGINLEPATMETWPGKFMVIPYSVAHKRTNREIEKRYGPAIHGGGNAINSAVMIFIIKTAAKFFLFVGNELSFKRRYYADRLCSHDEEVKFYAKDVKGRKVKTLFPLYEYKVWLENLASQLIGNYAFFNCSEGILGVDTDGSLMRGILQMPLPQAIEDVKQAFQYDQLPFFERQRIFYEEVYNSGLYSPVCSEYVWEYIRRQGWKFQNALDVGCGVGKGIADARKEGLEVWGVDFVDNPAWVDLGIQQYCSVASAHELPYPDNEFDLVVCTEVLEHIPQELIEDSLRQILRVGSDRFYFTVATAAEEYPMAGICNGHITIEPPRWWCDLLTRIGFKQIYSNIYNFEKPVTKKKAGLVIDCRKHA